MTGGGGIIGCPSSDCRNTTRNFAFYAGITRIYALPFSSNNNGFSLALFSSEYGTTPHFSIASAVNSLGARLLVMHARIVSVGMSNPRKCDIVVMRNRTWARSSRTMLMNESCGGCL